MAHPWVSAVHFCDKTAQSHALSHPIAAYLGMLEPDQRTHFPFPLPENVFVSLAETHFQGHFPYIPLYLERAEKAQVVTFFFILS